MLLMPFFGNWTTASLIPHIHPHPMPTTNANGAQFGQFQTHKTTWAANVSFLFQFIKKPNKRNDYLFSEDFKKTIFFYLEDFVIWDITSTFNVKLHSTLLNNFIQRPYTIFYCRCGLRRSTCARRSSYLGSCCVGKFAHRPKWQRHNVRRWLWSRISLRLAWQVRRRPPRLQHQRHLHGQPGRNIYGCAAKRC